MAARIITAVIGIPLYLLALWWGDAVWAGFLALVTGLAGWEITQLLRHTHESDVPSAPVVIAGGLLFILHAYAFDKTTAYGGALLIAALLVLAGLITEVLRRQGVRRPSLAAGGALLGAVYTGGLLAHLVLLRQLPDGFALTLMVTVGTWVSDSAAFFGGRAYGRHKLLPAVSPNKTWEGALTGLLFAGIAGVVMAAVFDLGLSLGWILGLAISAFGQLGDLAASALKRESGIKDTGKLLPGHGGVIDRFDSLMFAGVIVYYGQMLLAGGWPTG